VVLDRGYFVPLSIARTPWLDSLHALNTDMCSALLITLDSLAAYIVPVGLRCWSHKASVTC